MKRNTTSIIVMTAALAVAGCASTNGITVKGATDRTEDQVRVSSELFDEPFMGFPSPTDYYFAAAIDKQSGQKRYALYLNVNAENWQKWDQVVLDENGTPVALPVVWNKTDMICNDYGCAHWQIGVAGIGQNTLEYIASQSRPVRMTMASSRVSGKLAFDVHPDEARVFLEETRQLPL